MIEGSCLCGAVAYETDRAPERAHNCYCGRCRKARGAGMASNLFVPIEGFRWTRGEERLRRYQPPEAERFVHAFCGTCGASMPHENPARGLVVIPMGSLDSDPGMAPQRHIFVASKAPWVGIRDELPRFTAYTDSKRLD